MSEIKIPAKKPYSIGTLTFELYGMKKKCPF